MDVEGDVNQERDEDGKDDLKREERMIEGRMERMMDGLEGWACDGQLGKACA
jgi:hypothetical protein